MQSSLQQFDTADADAPTTNNDTAEDAPDTVTLPAKTVIDAMITDDTSTTQHGIELNTRSIVAFETTGFNDYTVFVEEIKEKAWVSPYNADTAGEMNSHERNKCVKALRGNTFKITAIKNDGWTYRTTARITIK